MIPACLLLILVPFCSCQSILQLNRLKAGTHTIDVTPPFAIFVSAFSDDDSALQKIFVKTDDNSISSVSNLKNQKASKTSGKLTPFPINTKAYITCNLDDKSIAALTGFIYISNSKQLYDEDFFVYDVDQRQEIKRDGNLNANSTIVLLNSNSKLVPVQSTMFTNWAQSPDASLFLYNGYPTDQNELSNSQLFSNPVLQTNYKYTFIPKVEKFALTLPVVYFKTQGAFTFIMEPGYYNVDGTQTSEYTSTGFYMKADYQNDRNVTIVCLRDSNFNGTTGANVVGSMDVGKVIIQENDGSQSSTPYSVSADKQILGWNTTNVGQNLTISSVHADGEPFFVQFYVLQGQQIRTDPVTTTTVATTTQYSSTCHFLISAIVALVLFAFVTH